MRDCTVKIWKVLLQVAQALAGLHSLGVVWLDGKPDNILIKDGKAYLADLGIAQQINPITGDLGVLLELHVIACMFMSLQYVKCYNMAIH